MFYLEKFQKINVYYLENFFIFIIKENRDGDFLNQVKHRDIHLAIFLTKKKDVPRFFTLLYHKNNLLSNKITTGLVSCFHKSGVIL